MQYLLFALHLIISFLICVVVLLQRSKGNGLAGAFGGVGAGEAMFGTHGVTTFLHKATIYLAVGFMVTSLSLAWITASRSESRARVMSGGETVLPVAGSVQVPDATESTDAAATDAVVPGSDIVPQLEQAPVSAEDSSATDKSGGSEGASEETQGGGGR